MRINSFELEMTNNGNGIYINNLLVDDKERLSDYWEGLDYWFNKLKENTNYDYLKRHELITNLIKNKK